MASRFAELGGDVVIASRQIKVLENAANEINAKVGSDRVRPVQMDIKSTEAIKSCFDAIGSPPDVVVNNAAGNFISPTERLSHNAFHNI